MKIDYVCSVQNDSELLVLVPECEAEYCQLKNLCEYMGIEWNYRHVSLKLK